MHVDLRSVSHVSGPYCHDCESSISVVQERRDGGTDRGIAGRGDNYFLHGLIAKSACLLERVHAYSHAL